MKLIRARGKRAGDATPPVIDRACAPNTRERATRHAPGQQACAAAGCVTSPPEGRIFLPIMGLGGLAGAPGFEPARVARAERSEARVGSRPGGGRPRISLRSILTTRCSPYHQVSEIPS